MKKYQLMAPGPTPVPSQVLLAMAQPMIHHRTPEYEALFAEVRGGLQKVFQTAEDVITLAQSSRGADEHGWRREFIQLARTASRAPPMRERADAG